MRIPLKYILRSSSSRRLTTVITILGIALVVFVFTAVLMMANGVEKTLRSTGSDDNLIVVRKAAMSEIMSILDRDAASIVSNMPQVASFADQHFLIDKAPQKGGGVRMSVVQLDKDTRVKEIARLISGEKISQTSLEHARQLIAESR